MSQIWLSDFYGHFYLSTIFIVLLWSLSFHDHKVGRKYNSHIRRESVWIAAIFFRENCVKFTISIQAMTGFYTTTWRRKLCMRAHECNTIVSRKHVGHRTLVNIPFHSCYAATAHSQWVPGKGVRMPISWWLQVHRACLPEREIWNWFPRLTRGKCDCPVVKITP